MSTADDKKEAEEKAVATGCLIFLGLALIAIGGAFVVGPWALVGFGAIFILLAMWR